jgi:hypothetical protein
MTMQHVAQQIKARLNERAVPMQQKRRSDERR